MRHPLLREIPGRVQIAANDICVFSEALMNLSKVLTATSALILAGLCGTLPARQFVRFLKAADIQQATGLKGVTQLPPTADSDLNFASQDGKVILSASFLPASSFAAARSSEKGFKSSLKGVGEEAFVGPANGPPLFVLVFRKGDYTVILNTELDDSNRPRLTLEQITAIAKIVASRM